MKVNRAWKDVHFTDIQLMVWMFDDLNSGEKALGILKGQPKEIKNTVLNGAVIVKDESGEIQTTVKEDYDQRRGTIFGAIAGGLVGMLAGPVGAVAGAGIGGAIGHSGRKNFEINLSEEFRSELREALKPGCSALVLLVEKDKSDDLQESLKSIGGELSTHDITKEIASYEEDN